MAVAIAFLGGRPAMITAATGAIALVIAPVAREYGIDYFIATVLLGGLIQVVLAVLGVAKLMRFIPRSVMGGFVNALAILIFVSQLPQLLDVPWLVYPLVAIGLLVILLMPRLTKAVPAPLVLHGSSGLPDEQLRLAVASGMTKVNISTHLNALFTDAVRGAMEAAPTRVDPRTYIAPGRDAVAAEVERLLRLLHTA